MNSFMNWSLVVSDADVAALVVDAVLVAVDWDVDAIAGMEVLMRFLSCQHADASGLRLRRLSVVGRAPVVGVRAGVVARRRSAALALVAAALRRRAAAGGLGAEIGELQ